MTTPLLQLLPSLPPPYEGVGSYAWSLSHALEESAGSPSHFLALAGGSGADGDGSRVLRLRERTAAELVRRLEQGTEGAARPRVLLHYVNYGYAPRGCPRWLAAGLESWRRAAPARRLVTIFHEVSATGPPWRSSFWLRPLQRRVAARVVRASDASITSLERYGAELRGLGAPKPPVVLPVFSAVGEPDHVPPLADRPRRLVVFGGPGTRRRAYREHRDSLERACRTLEIEEVLDVGPPLEEEPAGAAALPIRRCGPLAPAAVRSLLLDAVAGFVAYPREFLPKSTVFAAYCAHGLVPLQAWSPEAARSLGARAMAWVPAAGEIADGGGDLQALADRARAWYQPHRLDAHAALLRDLLGDGGAS